MKTFVGAVVVAAIIFYFNRGWFSGVVGIDTVTVTAAEVDCDRLAKEWTGQSVSNNFGAEFEILKIFDATEESRTSDKLTCLAEAMFDRGSDDKVRMSYEKDRDGEWWNKIEVLTD